MNREQLVAANSDLFSIHYRGIEFDAGWTGLFEELLRRWRESAPLPPVTQTKEKFGKFRVYCEDLSHPTARAIRADIEERSASTCQMCGAPGGLASRPGCIATLCDSCAERQQFTRT